ncbi:MAG TPA: hypothetical protein VLC09_12350 [Polyangiaceae bacterium]|nr:hypothetical protein [Polyangiaceae bacterium]
MLLPAVLALLSLTALLALVVPFPGPHDGSQRGVASQGPLLESSSTAPQHGHPSVRAEEVDANDLRLSAADPAPPAALLGGALLEPRSDAEPLLCVGSSATADPTGSPDRQVHSARGPPSV